jgi:hypothetical protein
LFNASQFGFRARLSTTLQCMRLTDHVTLNFNNKMSTTWHTGLLYKLSKLNFSTRMTKLIDSFLLQRKFRVSVEGEISMPRCMKAGMLQGSVLSPTLYNPYINDNPQIMGVNLTLFADDTCLHATEHKEGYVLRKLQRVLNSMSA